MPAHRTKAAFTPDADLRGQMAGEYRMLRQIGAGGFGTVYEAEHPVLKRKAAVKVLHASRTVDQAAVQRFVSEAQAATQIRHRHIVDIFSFGKLATGQHFYVMDLLDGAPLDRFLDEHERLKPEVALPLLRPVALALDAMHAHGIVHRDVKPANIFLAWESSGEVVPKLLDFGLVKLLADSPMNTASGVPMGTPYYMSPEQCRGEKIDARSDVYAFGIICHELLTGAPPFTGDTPTAVLVAHITNRPAKLSEVRAELPAELDAPVQHMLEKDRELRPSSVGAGFDELETAARNAGLAIQDGLPRLPRPSAPPPPSERELRSTFPALADGTPSQESAGRRTFPLWLAGALLLVLSAGSVYSLLGKTTASQAPGESATPAVEAPPPAVASAASPESSAASAPVDDHIEITLRGVPEGAQVFAFDRQIGETPAPVRLPSGPKEVELSIVARGFRPKTVKLVPSASQAVDVTLSRAPAPRRTVSKDLEDPF
jgi:serine/threonine protein kinase